MVCGAATGLLAAVAFSFQIEVVGNALLIAAFVLLMIGSAGVFIFYPIAYIHMFIGAGDDVRLKHDCVSSLLTGILSCVVISVSVAARVPSINIGLAYALGFTIIGAMWLHLLVVMRLLSTCALRTGHSWSNRYWPMALCFVLAVLLTSSQLIRLGSAMPLFVIFMFIALLSWYVSGFVVIEQWYQRQAGETGTVTCLFQARDAAESSPAYTSAKADHGRRRRIVSHESGENR